MVDTEFLARVDIALEGVNEERYTKEDWEDWTTDTRGGLLEG
jgi:hypothetical protein